MVSMERLWFSPDRDRGELIAGVLRVSEPPGGTHGWIATRLLVRLAGHVEAARLGVVLVKSGYLLSRRPDTVLGPDISFLAGFRGGLRVPDGFIEGAPDLAVEIGSPHDRAADLLAKVGIYLTAGTKLVWILDPGARSASVHRADGSVHRIELGGWLSGEEVVPEFLCPLEAIFR